MKIAYNDANVTKGLLSGKEWYTVNAFRALNQGLGRCIRHIKDWGAVLLVDERYVYMCVYMCDINKFEKKKIFRFDNDTFCAGFKIQTTLTICQNGLKEW